MRIGLIIDTFNIGGAETMVFEIAKLLSQLKNIEKEILMNKIRMETRKHFDDIKEKGAELFGSHSS